MRNRNAYIRALLMCATAAYSTMTMAAEQPSKEFHIPAGNLATALRTYGLQAGEQILFQDAAVQQLWAPAVMGRYSSSEALDLMLKGSGIQTTRSANGVILLQVPPTAPARLTKIADQTDFPSSSSSSSATPSTSRPQQSDADIAEVVVTGSRVVRDGYEAPTPVSVVGAEEIAKSATANVADYVNTLPAIAGSATPTGTSNSVGNGRQGVNSLNLHSIGATRTLTLLDGRRVGGAINDGTVDISELPQQLVSRVDVVTGGASASYGSDALSGVVNFVLDTKFTGLKGEVSGGETTYNDNKNWKVALTYGTGFANDRGHFLLSGDIEHEDGIFDPSNRQWVKAGYSYINNPTYTATNGQPRVLLRPQVALSTATLGGAIACSSTSACASLRGIAFGPGGAMYNLVFGPIVSDPVMSGGTYGDNSVRQNTDDSLIPRMERQNTFARASYDVTDDWNIFVEGSWAHSVTETSYYYGSFANNLTVSVDNPYMPAALATQIRALGLTSVPFGTMLGDKGASGAYADHGYVRTVVGADGKFVAFDTDWKLSAYYEYARATMTNIAPRANYVPHLKQAMDAVRAPNGSIICRSTLTSPNDGCVAFNVFGTGVNSQAQIDYVRGYPTLYQVFTQNVASVNIAGEPFSIWAGPVSVAFGAEHRTESAKGFADAITTADPGNWDTTGGLPTVGSYNVSDAYIETVVPLAKDTSWARSLTVNTAARGVKYVNGTYGTWKIGAEYEPVDSVRFRSVLSRDVREANLADRFAGVFQVQSSFTDPNKNGATTTARSLGQGNPNLNPEIGKTFSAGVVLQPTFLPGFNSSVDFYKVNITGAIGSLSVQQIVNLCYAGNQQACALIVPTPTAPNQYDIYPNPLNLASERTKGLDLEASYRFNVEDLLPGMGGSVSIRGLATHYIRYAIDSGIPGAIVTQRAGTYQLPDWRYQLSVNYNNGPLSLTGTMRGVTPTVFNNAYIECQSGCPATTADHPTYDNNHVAGKNYFDLAAAYKFGEDTQTEVFFNVRNIANLAPPIVVAGPSGYSTWHNNLAFSVSQYDVLGRVFRGGVRFKM